MNQSAAGILLVAALTLSIVSCAASRPAPDSSISPASDSEASATVPVPDASSAQSADPQPSTGTSASTSATASPSLEPPRRAPRTGLPSAQFCNAGETYLGKFPGLPRVQPPGAATVPPPSMCVYMSGVGDSSVPTAMLSFLDLSGRSDEIPKFKKSCEEGFELAPTISKIDADWAQSRGWSGWTMTNGTDQLAMLCTDDHAFSAGLSNVPGSTPEDALNTILAAID